MEIKKESRGFGIKGFRNIGFSEKGETEERLILNYSLNKEYMGDLVILIGPNNAGKSNVLAAITSWMNNTYGDKRNISDVFMEANKQIPLVELFTLVDDKRTLIKPVETNNQKDSQTNESMMPVFNVSEYLPKSPLPNEGFESYYGEIKDGQETIVIQINQYIDAINFAKNAWSIFDALQKYHVNFAVPYYNKINILIVLMKEILDDLASLEKMKGDSTSFKDAIEYLKGNKFFKIFLNNYESYLTQLADFIAKILTGLSKEKTEVKHEKSNHVQTNSNDDLTKYVPNIIEYNEHFIKNEDLICKADDIGSSTFFSALLKMMGSDIDELKHLYKQVREASHYALLTTESKKLNKKLAKITKYFNELYCLRKDKYQFTIELNSNEIFFSIFKQASSDDEQDVPLYLDYQSTGFRWFFDLFFNVFATNKIVSGDIIIMDEPATNLHVHGQMELRKFLKQFALTNGITFVIATHSPFMVDLDYLDEVRIISTHHDNVATIDNKFTVINPDDTDALLPIRESLTVTNNIMINPDQIVVFVEGITDYNYLVGFKNWCKIPDYLQLTFLPIKGLGNSTEEYKKRLDQLQRIRHLNSILLTDGDLAGKEFASLNSASMHPLRLISLNKLGFTEIENLFSREDQIKFGILAEESKDKDKWVKDTGKSVTFKKILLKDALNDSTHDLQLLSQKTQDNFKKVFDEIIRLVRKSN